MAKKKKTAREKKPRKKSKEKEAAVSDVDAFNKAMRAQKLQEARQRGHKELQLWNKWDSGGRQAKDLAPLMKSVNNVINSKARQLSRQGQMGIPHASLRADLKVHALKGIQTFDPNRGTKLTTHLHNNFQRITDNIAKNRNFARITSKPRFQGQAEYRNVFMEEKDRLQRDPSLKEMQNAMSWPPREVARAFKEYKTEHVMGDPEGRQSDAEIQFSSTMQLVDSVLKNPQEKEMFQKWHQAPQKPKMRQLAKQMGISQARGYRIRNKVDQKIGPYIKKL